MLGQEAGGELVFLAAPMFLTTTSYRFPDGFEKFSPPILQLDEVDFYYDPKHVIFSRLSVSADLESRICVVWFLFLCSVSRDSPTPACGVIGPDPTTSKGNGMQEQELAWAKDSAILLCRDSLAGGI